MDEHPSGSGTPLFFSPRPRLPGRVASRPGYRHCESLRSKLSTGLPRRGLCPYYSQNIKGKIPGLCPKKSSKIREKRSDEGCSYNSQNDPRNSVRENWRRSPGFQNRCLLGYPDEIIQKGDVRNPRSPRSGLFVLFAGDLRYHFVRA